MVPPQFLKRLALWLSCASVVTILLSIAISTILLALALSALLLSGLPLRWPKISIPLALFLAWTLVALVFSPDPAFGLPSVRKMVIYLTLLIVFSSVRTLAEAKWLTLAWMGVGTLTAGRGLAQFARDVAGARALHQDFYHFYIADRIRGFMGHWMTFSGQELYILLLILAFLLYAPNLRRYLWLALPCGAAVGIALIFSLTRTVWVAAFGAAFYLLWGWKRWAALAMPAVVAIGLLVAPNEIQERARSFSTPHGATDSNQHRKIVWLTGWQMIKAHPITGVGPEEIRKPAVFFAYLPSTVQRPLPDGDYQHLHSIYIHYAAECGIPAAVFLTAALIIAFVDFHRAGVRLPPGRSIRRFLLSGAAACVIGTMISGLSEKNLGDTEVLTMFLAITCLGYLAAAPEPPQAPAVTG